MHDQTDPQGSVLGHDFTLYMYVPCLKYANVMIYTITRSYADDTHLYTMTVIMILV